MNMKHTTDLTEVLSSVAVHRLKIDNFAVTAATIRNNTACIKSRCSVAAAAGYDWEIRFYPARFYQPPLYFSTIELVFLAGAWNQTVAASLSIRLLDYKTSGVQPIQVMPTTKTFTAPSDLTYEVNVATACARDVPGSLTEECTISVRMQKEEEPNAICRRRPCSGNLRKHLGELLESKAGADVTFAVSGETFAAHKSILAARSPVFMAQFFGAMVDQSPHCCIEVQEMDAEVFEAMLHFIYTDMEPELDEKQQPEAAEEMSTAMAQHLLVAADRYGLERLKVICEGRLSVGIDVGTAASTLALAEKHNCSELKAKCIEFIGGGSPEILEAVLATEGYRDLEASFPWMVTEILKAAIGRMRIKPAEGNQWKWDWRM